MMKLLITGANGYIGSRLIAALSSSSENTIFALVKSTRRFKVQARLMPKIQRATFRPKGLLGRIYWYALYPIHHFIFKRMAKKIVEKATIKHRE